MYKIPDKSCRKCGGITKIRWDSSEKSTGMYIKELRPAGMKRTCLECGFEEIIHDLESEQDNKVPAKD